MVYDADEEIRGGHGRSTRENHDSKHKGQRAGWIVVCPDGKTRGLHRFFFEASAKAFAEHRMTHAGAIESCRQNGCPKGRHTVERMQP